MNDAFLILEPAESLDWIEPSPPKPRRRITLRSVFRALLSAMDWVFGAVALTIGLSVLAAMPLIQFLSFGYLLEASGRVARSGRLRDGFVGIRKASRLGSMVVGTSLFLLPLYLLSGMAEAAQLVNPDGLATRLWKAGLIVATVLVLIQMMASCARGGRIWHFLIPFGNPFWIRRRIKGGGAYTALRDAVWNFAASLRLPYYYRLGLLGFLGTMIWLSLPVTLMAVARKFPPSGFLGALWLGLVVMPLPFLQTRFAVENRFRELFALRAVRDQFKRAPWAFAFSLLLTLMFALPLYLLKIEIIPRETAWLPSLVFIAFIYPARVLTGWAYGRSLHREQPRHWFFRWTGRLPLLPVAFFYVLVVFLSQYTAWRGVWSLYEQHAFLLPVPFLGQ